MNVDTCSFSRKKKSKQKKRQKTSETFNRNKGYNTIINCHQFIFMRANKMIVIMIVNYKIINQFNSTGILSCYSKFNQNVYLFNRFGWTNVSSIFFAAYTLTLDYIFINTHKRTAGTLNRRRAFIVYKYTDLWRLTCMHRLPNMFSLCSRTHTRTQPSKAYIIDKSERRHRFKTNQTITYGRFEFGANLNRYVFSGCLVHCTPIHQKNIRSFWQ